jgi:tripartite-type tricarboxylate transporter receptor subunit TctC
LHVDEVAPVTSPEMKARMPARRSLLLGLAASTLVRGARAAEPYPSRTIRFVIPFPPGTSSELVVRTIADRLATRFGQAVIIENRPGGAGGTVGAATVANAEPDGYTLLVSSPGPLAAAAALYSKLGYDPASFASVGTLFESPMLLAVHRAVPASSLPELVAHAKRNPGKISFASPGYGTQPHLLGELLKTTAGINIVHVPYRGPVAALTDLAAGQVHVCFETSPFILPHAQAGTLRVLAVASARRASHLPDIPTVLESGFPDLIGTFWSAVVAPGGTPREIVTMLNTAITRAMDAANVKDVLIKIGAEAKLGTSDECGAFIAGERRRWTAVIRTTGVRIE